MNIKENRKLVENFFISAEKVLQENGNIIVTLCRKQGGTDAEVMPRLFENSWKIVNLAASAGLILCDIEFFNSQLYNSYKCTGYRGLSKKFDTDGAVTHFFCRGQAVLMPADKSGIHNLSNKKNFIHDIKCVFECLTRKVSSPYSKIVSVIDDVASSSFISLQKIFISNLLFCRAAVSPCASIPQNEKLSNCDSINICCKCLDTIISEFLRSKENDEQNENNTITSLISCICCMHYFKTHFHPFMHFVSYFSSSLDSLLRGFQSILESIKLNFPLNSKDFCWNDLSSYINAKPIIPDQSHYLLNNPEYIQSIYLTCSVAKSNCCVFYTDIEIVMEHRKNFCPSSIKNNFEIGQIIKFTHLSKMYYVILLNLETISSIKFHVMDYRILLLQDSYFCNKVCQDSLCLVYRPLSLYPPLYLHDISFWINESFSEESLFILAWNIVGELVKSIKLIDIYQDILTKRESRCYRFYYQSFNKALDKEELLKIHLYVRKAIEDNLKIQLR
ncbi:ferredoxin-fold anticodon-binding domain-containing protein 1 homolog isoform X2 [Argiope bruennichi]|nr:ferredoxin-fold anticodon-binding domain-containing protein 1 homolog isoform X2 [Argiope bruennichi]